MVFNSFGYLCFFPIVLLLNFVVPKRFRPYWLLAASFYFYGCWNVKYVLLLLCTVIVTYGSARIIRSLAEKDGQKSRGAKAVLVLTIVIILAQVAYFKYFNFGLGLIGGIMEKLHVAVQVPRFDILLPVGISFFTFQSLGYVVDVYRGDLEPERNFFQYALFVSFFPQLVAGPIERSKRLMGQLKNLPDFDYERSRSGFLLLIWGLILKMVLADRVAIFVDYVYGNYRQFPGAYLLVATFFFSIQIYCDFAGYSLAAKGSAQILGVELMDNFASPYISTSVSEFWRNWHISLTSWFRDYVYIPLGGSRSGKWKKYRNQLIVFALSGLWHGADLSFVLWGLLNGCYQIAEDLLKGVRGKFAAAKGSYFGTVIRVIWTSVLVDFAWIFFRAANIEEGLSVAGSILRMRNLYVLFDGSLYRCGLNEKNFRLVLVLLLVLLVVDILNKRGVVLREVILRQGLVGRCVIVAAAILFLFLFGIWGPQYSAASFIYFQF